MDSKKKESYGVSVAMYLQGVFMWHYPSYAFVDKVCVSGGLQYFVFSLV